MIIFTLIFILNVICNLLLSYWLYWRFTGMKMWNIGLRAPFKHIVGYISIALLCSVITSCLFRPIAMCFFRDSKPETQSISAKP
jgi:hypothetical protein